MWKYPVSKSNIRLAVAGWISGICLFAHCAETTSDIVIYGSSPAAISAAVQAKRMGKSAVIVSPESRIGGLTTGGLGQTDIGNKSAFGGIALEFYRDVAKWYAESAHWTRQTPEQYKPDGQTAGTMGKDSMWTFEPSAALAILEGWEKRDKLDIRRGEWLDRDGGVTKEGGRIVSIKTLSGNVYRGKVFVDATYEGDLMAAAGVSYTVGREANSVYGETISGIQFREARAHQLKWHVSAYVEEGNPESGLLPGIEPRNPDEKDGDGDKRVQAYCFRMCLTDDPVNRIPFKKPANYDEKEYELLFRNFAKGESAVPWINSKMPNRKTDTNNRLGFSTDFIGRNWEWPEATYERRAEIFKAHLDYQKGLMWTLANHPRVPEKIRAEVSKWGTCKDEFLDGPGDGWQSQLYVREARRMVGEYVMTEHECRGDRVAPHPVAMGAYTMDSHNVRRVVTARGNVQNEGDVEDRRRYSAWGPDADKRAKGGRMKPYGIDYGAICPKRGECENLLVPVCLSASHMAFGSIRMEPVFFALGQVAGTAASLAVGGPTSVPAVQDVPYATLAARLGADGQVMELKTSTPGRACVASVAPSAKFTDGMLSKTRSAGWLAEACRVQAEGLCGHPEALSYPYDTCLWAGEIPRMGKHGQDWWRYEQTAYYVDGLLRLGYATGDESFIKKGEENIDYTLEHAAPDGHLGHPSLWDATRYKLKNGYDMWPLAVFFRAMKAKYDAAPDARIPAALQKNFLNYDKERISKVRNVINAEGLLWTYAHTGDKRLLDLAEKAWNMRQPLPPEKKNELAPKNCANNDAIHMHGVSYCEEMKVPMILYAYTGKKEYLNQAVNVERKLVRDHMLPDGCPTSAERTLGNSVHVCHETCDVADYTWSLGYFLEATGDAAYADRIERCVFNAGFGAIGNDFKSLQYFSNVNQFIATSNSDHNPQNYGTTWMQYRPTHETECCAGNVNRILPNYISRMWLKDKDGGPVAALYGPSEVDFGWAKIKEETNYPFDGKVVFRFSMAEPKESAFTYRVPGWCKGASVKVNGESVAAARPGSFATIGRRFADGDVIELDLPMDVCFEEVPRRFVVDGKDVAKRLVKRPAAKFANSSQGTVVTRGPLVFAYSIPTERTEDIEEHKNMNGKKSASPGFKSWNLKPAGPFNYALAAHKAEVVMGADAINCVPPGLVRNPAGVKIRVSAKRIDWKLDEDRFTPDLPERPLVLSDDIETIELVPYGLTMLRLGVFPDVSQETFAATVWRGETAYVDIPAGVSVARLVSQAKDGVSVAFGYFDEVAYEMQPDGVDIRKRPDVYREDARRSPTVARVAVAPDAKPGVYNFGPFEVRVLNRVLPPAKEWKYFLDLWQHPWAVSRYFNVEPFSKEHYAKMEPIWRALADCGCKALTVTLLDLPWNHQCYDGYYSMVGRVRKADGTWVFDYRIFDEYVEFGRKCGLGPDIACYTMCPWKYMATWKEEGTVNEEQGFVERREKLLPGTPEFEDYWGAFLVDFAAHLKEKGWFKDAYIAMDERGPEDVKKIVNLIQAKAPGLKVAICGKTKPSAFAGIQIENFCQGLIHLRDDFLPELAPRRAKGYKTTFYVCCTAKHPNTFMESPRDEGFYLGAYPVMIGFDGFLRWAANSWGENPYKDASFRTKDWKAGDAFLIYPGGELSQRLIDLRAGVVAAEKMRILRGQGSSFAKAPSFAKATEDRTEDKTGNRERLEKKISDIAKRFHFFASVRDPSFDFAAFRREVETLVNSERCADLSSGAFAKSEAATALKVKDLKRLKRELAVPCETNGWGQLFVRCQVNGVECRLLVDTGCTLTYFDMPFVERAFGRDAVRSVKDPRAAVSNIDSIRKSGAALKLHGVSMSISGVEFGGLDVTVIDGDWDESDGMLGLDVLGSVPTLVSVGDRKLVFNLRERKGFKSYTSGGFVPGGEDICSFFGIVNGKPVSFLLDTGCNMTQLMGGQGWQWKPGMKGESQVDNINGSRKVEMACGMPTSVTACDIDISMKRPIVKFGDPKLQKINCIGVDTLKDYDILVWDRYFYSVRPRDAKLREDVSPVFLDLDFDTTAAPDLKKWTRSVLGGARYMRNAVSAVAIYITSGWPVPRRVKVAYVDDDGAPPVRIADGTPADVYLNAKWFRENKDGDAAGTFFRALVQVMQGYKKTLGATEENSPKWLAEGIAEYAKCYIFDRYSGKRDYACDDVGACRYSDSCRATASFLNFVERNHRGTLVRANAALRAHAFDDGTFWKEATGKTADELEKLWRTKLADLSSGAFAKAEAATALKVEDLKRLKRELAVPCETNDWGQLVVRCQVNGVECRLLVDTGCTLTYFDMPFVERAFGRDAVRSVKDPRAAFSNIDSIRESGSALNLHGVSMSISGVEFGGLDVTVTDGDWDSDWDEKDGILGLDVLGSVPTLVSVGDRKLVFNLRERKGFKSFTAGGFVPGGEYICSFFGIVNGKPVSFLLDTGGNMTQLMGGQGWQWKPGTKVECKVGDINGIRKVEMACGMPTSVTACDVDISMKRPIVNFGDPKHQRINMICVDTLKDYDILVCDRYFYSVRPRDAKLREDVSPVFLDLDFDTTAAPDLKEWSRSALGGAGCLRNAVSGVAIYITSGWPVPRRVNVAYVDDDGAPPVRIADGKPADVYLNAKWFRENKDGDAAGTFFRALVQVMQGYEKTLGATEENCPKWLAEGIAEYAKCYIFDQYSGKRDYSCDNVGACRYRDSCRATASFLDFVERNHRGTVTRANAALRAHAFDDGTFWKEATGMTADELEKLWRVELAGGVATAAPAPMERKETE